MNMRTNIMIGDNMTYGDDKMEEFQKSQTFKNLRKAMQEAIEKIKQELKEALAKLKDIAEQNELAYRQGYASIEEYFSQKAQLEYEEAQLKVKALQDEINEKLKVDKGCGSRYNNQAVFPRGNDLRPCWNW